MNKFHGGVIFNFYPRTTQDRQKREEVGDEHRQVGTNVGVCDQMNAKALIHMFCVLYFSLLWTTALILYAINSKKYLRPIQISQLAM